MPTAQGYTAVPDAGAGIPTTDDALRHASGDEGACFPTRAVAILTLGMTVNSYAMVSLFPYVGMMVKELLSLQSTNEVGEQRRDATSGTCIISVHQVREMKGATYISFRGIFSGLSGGLHNTRSAGGGDLLQTRRS